MMLRAFICGALSACLLPFGAAQVSDPASAEPIPIDTTPFVFEQGDYRVTITPYNFLPSAPKKTKEWTSERTASSDVQMASTRTGRVPYRLHVNETRVTDEYDVFPAADFVTFTYEREDVADLSQRPVIFAFNGGPGSSSIWLHMSALGPKRIDIPAKPDTWRQGPYDLVDNPAFLIDVADIVLVDPVGTGLSRVAGDGDQTEFYHLRRDARSVCLFMETWLRANDRYGAPVHIIGSSYGTIRSTAIRAHRTCRDLNTTVRSLIFVSGVLDFTSIDFNAPATTTTAGRLPTVAMTAWYHGLIDTSVWDDDLAAFRAEVERFTYDALSPAIWRGRRNQQSDLDRLIQNMTRLTGLSADVFQGLAPDQYILAAMRGVNAQVEGRTYRQDSRFTLLPRGPRPPRIVDPERQAAEDAAMTAFKAARDIQSNYAYSVENMVTPQRVTMDSGNPLDIAALDPVFKAHLQGHVGTLVDMDGIDTYIPLMGSRSRFQWEWSWGNRTDRLGFVREMGEKIAPAWRGRMSASVRASPMTAAQFSNMTIRLVEDIVKAPRIMIASGRHDMHTPYYTVLIAFEQAGIPPALMQTHLYEGGHFFYADGEIAEKFSDDVRAFIGAQ